MNTIGDIIAASARQYAERTAIVGYHQGLTFRAVDRLANKFANGLSALGLAPGARVGIIVSNRWEYAIAYFGIAKAGMVSVHISTRYEQGGVEQVLKSVPLEAIIIDDAMRDRIGWANPFLADARIIIAGGRTDGEMRMMTTMLEMSSDSPPEITIDPDSVSAILFTSGTTGRPKASLQTHRGRVQSSEIALWDFSLQADDVIVVASPLSHTTGLYTWFQTGVLAGASTVLLPEWDAGVFVAAVSTLHVTGAFASASQLATLIKHPGFNAQRLSSLRLIVYGGAPANPVMIAAVERTLPHVRLVQNYGQTEVGPLFSQQPADRHLNPAAIGRPNGRVDVELFVRPGRRAAIGEIGEIATRGKHVSPGYFGDDEVTRNLFRGGDDWAWTGDLAIADEQGQLTLIGRTFDTIFAGGVSVYPGELERIVQRHPNVADCAAFGMADPTWGELPAIAVVPKPRTRVSPREVEALFTGAEIGQFNRPRAVFIVESLPYTPAGKLLRSELKKRFPSN
ncbi:MAG: class I adenylate-forming enzyme family protein [Burkholderiales bacterium]